MVCREEPDTYQPDELQGRTASRSRCWPRLSHDAPGTSGVRVSITWCEFIALAALDRAIFCCSCTIP